MPSGIDSSSSSNQYVWHYTCINRLISTFPSGQHEILNGAQKMKKVLFCKHSSSLLPKLFLTRYNTAAAFTSSPTAPPSEYIYGGIFNKTIFCFPSCMWWKEREKAHQSWRNLGLANKGSHPVGYSTTITAKLFIRFKKTRNARRLEFCEVASERESWKKDQAHAGKSTEQKKILAAMLNHKSAARRGCCCWGVGGHGG